ncbi:MAG: hypothetical protein JNK75_04530 [Betaproteobacteria bacterium]|nr:hypothetical protein [Betaproteobacteria bacterium]
MNAGLLSALASGGASVQNREQRAQIIAALKAFSDLPAPLSVQQVRELFSLENALYPVIQADKAWFFASPGRVEAVQFSRDLHVLHSVTAKALRQLIERRGEWSTGDADPLLHHVMAFALFHHGASIKWCFYRHEPVKPTLWPDLHALYRFAERAGMATVALSLFEQERDQQTTILALYLRALLLEVLNTGSLTMPQIEIADGWLAEWCPEYALDETYAPRSHAMVVDLDAMAGLQLVTGSAPRAGFRYLRLDGLKAQIDAVKAQLRSGQPYHGRSTARHFAVEEHVALLGAAERLYTTILQASASRIEERTPVSGRTADLVIGFKLSRQALTPPAAPSIAFSFDESAAPPLAEDASRWRLHDLSSKGIGLTVDRSTGEKTAVGEFIAIRVDGFQHWMAGVAVRKVTQRALGETLVGIELLSYRPLPVVLHRYNHPRDAEPDPNTAPVDAIYLPGRDPEGKADILALPAGDFGLKNVFKLSTRDTNFRVRINRVLRKGRDWIGLRFEVIGKK